MEKQLRLAQIEEKERSRDMERQIQIKQELSENARAQQLIELDEEKKRQMREEKRRSQELLTLENDRLRGIKDELKKKQADKDMQMIKENM